MHWPQLHSCKTYREITCGKNLLEFLHTSHLSRLGARHSRPQSLGNLSALYKWPGAEVRWAIVRLG